MRVSAIPAIAALLLAVPALAGEDGAQEAAADTNDEITDRSHPDFVKCRKESVVGSRAKKRTICLTNRQWAAVARQGRGMATELVEGGRGGIDWEAIKTEQRTCQRVIC